MTFGEELSVRDSKEECESRRGQEARWLEAEKHSPLPLDSPLFMSLCVCVCVCVCVFSFSLSLRMYALRNQSFVVEARVLDLEGKGNKRKRKDLEVAEEKGGGAASVSDLFLLLFRLPLRSSMLFALN